MACVVADDSGVVDVVAQRQNSVSASKATICERGETDKRDWVTLSSTAILGARLADRVEERESEEVEVLDVGRGGGSVAVVALALVVICGNWVAFVGEGYAGGGGKPCSDAFIRLVPGLWIDHCRSYRSDQGSERETIRCH